MPAMTAREFVDIIAVPTVEDFMADPSQRRGYLACLAVYHVGDYLKPAGERFASDVHQAMESRLGAPFLVLQRMADAVKHREKVQGRRGSEVLLMQSGADTVRPPAGFGQCSPEQPVALRRRRRAVDPGRRAPLRHARPVRDRAASLRRTAPGRVGELIDRWHPVQRQGLLGRLRRAARGSPAPV